MVKTLPVVAAALLGAALVAVACIGDEPRVSPAANSSGAAPVADASSAADAATPYAIRCGGAVCRSAEVCCIASTGGAVTGTACKAKVDCATTYLECDSQHECPSGLYCYASTNGGSYDWISAACSAGCTGSERQLCDDAAECDGGCIPNPGGLRPPGLRACPQ